MSDAAAHDIDLLFWLGGDFADVELRNQGERTMDSIRREFPGWYLTLLIDGPEWADFASGLECGRRIVYSGPQASYAEGLRTSKLPWAAFVWPGSEPAAQVYRELRESAADADLIYAEGVLPIPAGTAHPVQHGRLKMFDAIPMERCLLSTATASRVVFDQSALHQRTFWWDFTIRLSRHHRIASRACSSTMGATRPWTTFPFSNRTPLDLDLAARYTNHGNDPIAFLNDVRRDDVRPWPIKVMVLGGIFEPHHNELCFFMCFEKLRGRGYLTWRTALYEYCRPEDLIGYDLVIFSRPRDPNCRALMDACAGKIATIVMIDDNWMALGLENERYRPLFGPGQPQMEIFLSCVRKADIALVYNPVLAQDIAPFARCVVELPPHVDAQVYEGTSDRSTLLIGYSGSQRPDTAAFRALAAFAEKYRDVEVLFLGPPLPPELSSLDPGRIHWAPFQMNYEDYTKKIARLHPDILLAPLDASRASASKAPNKFLEISALGAAGIYSRVAPYTSYVEDGKTGLLVGDDLEDWAAALERLYLDRGQRTSIASAAHRLVLEDYSVERVIPKLLGLFQSALS